MALSKEQFAELRKKGLSVQQIVSFESGKKPEMAGGKFTVPETQVDRQNKISQYQQEATRSAEETKNANSPLGFLKNFGKSVVSTVANSEVALGKSIAKIIGAGDTALTDAQKNSSDTEVALLKRINERKAQGADTTRLKQEYNRLKGSQGEVNDLVKEQFTLPTTGEVVGQIGGTALDILTAGTYGKATKAMTTGQRFVQPSVVKNVATGVGLPELGKIAEQKAAGLFTKRGLGNIATGSAIGYASDVTQGLQGARGEDRTGAKAFIPGVGTALGTAIPALSETNQSIKNQFTTQGKEAKTKQVRTETLADLEKKYKKVQKAFVAGDKKGVDVRKILSETDLLNGAVDADGHISKEIAMQNFDEVMAPWEGKVREKLAAEGAKASTQALSAQADDFVRNSRLLGSDKTKLENQILADLNALSKNGNTIPVVTLHDLKVQRGGRNNYLDPDTNAVNKEVTRFFKEMVEKNTKALDVPTYNSELSKLYAVRDAIEALDRTKVKGARLGKYFSQIIGAAAGGSVGGPLGAILGAEAGDLARGAQLSRSLGGDINQSLAPSSRMIDALTPKATGKEAIPPVVMPRSIPVTGQSSKSGSLKITQSNTMIPTNIPHNNVIPKTVSSSKPSATKLPTEGKEMFAGIGLGFEKDENGEIVFNEDKALAGMIGVAGLTRSQKVQKLSKGLDDTMRKLFVDYINVVRNGGVKTVGGKLIFESPEAEKAYDKGISFINGEANNKLDLNKIANSANGKIADLFQEVVEADKTK